MLNRKLIVIICCSLLIQTSFTTHTAAQSQPATIKTRWAKNVTPDNVLPEYPRPQLSRSAWTSLNGTWQYAILPKAQAQPAAFAGDILVPYPVESALSGVQKTVGKDSVLWYKRTFNIPSSYKNKQVILHFGAVDWQTDVYINGQHAGTHKGGYDPFSFNITPLLKKRGAQEITIKVWDPTDQGPQPRGKQVTNPQGIWYTPVTGIWQTVWLEPVAATYIASLKPTPDIDNKTLSLQARVENLQPGDQVKIKARDGDQTVAEETLQNATAAATLNIPSPKLWSPSSPFLYDLSVAVVRKGKVIDEVKSYFAMRKISMEPDEKGVQRMLLNNKFVFQYGPLDQGWWPDGLYTAPTDEALKFDIEKTKAMGFNMIRKHVKVEPARWYYYCDQLGMLVWQDMPSGDLGNGWENRPGVLGRATDKDRTAESEQIYRTEWKAIMDALYPFPSIVVWVPFNEAWGQFKTEEITKWTEDYDPSRLVNSASGGNFYPVGHMIDLHSYPDPAMPRADLFGKQQALVLGEFGGLGLPLEGHTWQQKDNWGYRSFKNADDLFKVYSRYCERMKDLIKAGLSAAVYTQTTDVEMEVNGLMTYDREVIKVPVEKLKAVHDDMMK
ncbi:glycoside hydrolase family 2 protein [Chitinophaga japonensis]|uniref:Glycosyl hydrolase family 2 n=1 Tax=Chitinophaga japonensis TaxID=104662 RepID=A0A562T0W1_CHIJA|nr:sugar-binding domain-containing protein [Chitinophaga japonensis]TWI86686.1 glycosyl hydrolase family 2 [Chitinophaga japonensis]